MDNALIQLAARLKIRLRQDLAVSLNTQRFFEDSTYARATLDRAEESEDAELVAMSIEMRSRLGWLEQAMVPAAVSSPTDGKPAPENPRYKFGARG
ncbi:MAG: hypothetical protein QM639_14060 [Rhodocyclaceae bacterium]